MKKSLKLALILEALVAFGPFLIIIPGTLGTAIIGIFLEINSFTLFLFVTSFSGFLGIIGLLIVLLKLLRPTSKSPYTIITIILILSGFISLLMTYGFLYVSSGGKYQYFLLIPFAAGLHFIYLWVKLLIKNKKTLTNTSTQTT